MDHKAPLAVRIVRGGKTIKQSIVSAPVSTKINDLVKDVLKSYPTGSYEVADLYAGSKSFDKNDLFEISAEMCISDAVSTIGSCSKIVCILCDELDPSSKPTPSAFDKMMNRASSLQLPPKRQENNGRDGIYNSLIDYLQQRKVGFRVFQKTDMDLFMSSVVSALWYLDGQWEKFASAPGVSRLPENLQFKPDDRETFRVIHHGTQKKKAVPQMKTLELVEHFEKLDQLGSRSFFRSEEWKVVLSEISSLKQSIADYIHHLSRAELARDEVLSTVACHDNRSLRTIEPSATRGNLVKSLYFDLEQKLMSVPPYVAVNVIFFAPSDRRAKYNYISGICFDFTVQLYRSFKPHATFIWRTSEEGNETALACMIADIEGNMVERVKTDRMKMLLELYGSTAKWSTETIGKVVSFATDGEDCAPQDIRDMESGLQFLLEEGYDLPEALMIDEEAHESKNDRFANFWNAVEQVMAINDYAVSEERRHGSTSWISPLCVSLRDLMEKSERKMEELFPDSEKNFIPSYEYFRLQFTPRNSTALVAKRYYGRFDIKFGLQTRTLHKFHVDHYYGAKQFQYLKTMAGLFSEHALIYFLDDKSSIPVGYAGAPVSATRRQRPVLMAGLDARGLNAMDHDNVPQHIIPSVSIKLIPPKVLTNAWYAGKPTIILKDAIFETSTAFRHAAELVKHAEEDDRERPILFIGTDGGPDHNLTSIQVILSYIALFFEQDLDFLCAVRTPPNFSIINPAERFMSTANLGLIGVALSRNHLGSDENKVRSLLSKKQWRSSQDKHPEVDYRKLARDGIKDSVDLLTRRFEALTYKGENVSVRDPATDHEIETLKKQITRVWPEIDLSGKVTKSQVLSIESVREFFDDHVRCTTYAFQVKKCTDDSCPFHKPVWVSDEVYKTIKWLPTPERDGEKYKDFVDVHGTEPNDSNVPSKQINKTTASSDTPKPPFPLAYTRARKIVVCTECEFPRLLYTKYAMEKGTLAKIDEYIDEVLYVCGSHLDPFPDIYQNNKLACYDAVSLHYYQAGPSLPDYRDLCAKCLDPRVVSNERKLLLCKNCLPKSSNISTSSRNAVEKRPKGRPKKNKS